MRDLVWKVWTEDELFRRRIEWIQCDASNPVNRRKGNKEKNAASNEHYTRKDEGIVVDS